MKQIDLKDQYFGTEIEMTGISRYDAAVAIGRMFGTEPYHIRSYDSWCVKDSDGKTWKFSRDSSIDCERLANGTVIDADGDYSTEMVSPKLEYSEMGKLQEVVRCVKNAGAFVNSSCGMHVHVDASNHTPRSLKNALTIMYCKEDILFKALNVQTRREDEYCQKVRPMVFARTKQAAASLTEQIKDHTFEKDYQAVLTGWLPDDEGTFRDFLLKERCCIRISVKYITNNSFFCDFHIIRRTGCPDIHLHHFFLRNAVFFQ